MIPPLSGLPRAGPVLQLPLQQPLVSHVVRVVVQPPLPREDQGIGLRLLSNCLQHISFAACTLLLLLLLLLLHILARLSPVHRLEAYLPGFYLQKKNNLRIFFHLF